MKEDCIPVSGSWSELTSIIANDVAAFEESEISRLVLVSIDLDCEGLSKENTVFPDLGRSTLSDDVEPLTAMEDVPCMRLLVKEVTNE